MYQDAFEKSGKIEFGGETVESPEEKTFEQIKVAEGAELVVHQLEEKPQVEVRARVREKHVNQGWDPEMIGEYFKKDVLAQSGNMLLAKRDSGYSNGSAFYNYPLPDKGRFKIKIHGDDSDIYLGFINRTDVFNAPTPKIVDSTTYNGDYMNKHLVAWRSYPSKIGLEGDDSRVIVSPKHATTGHTVDIQFDLTTGECIWTKNDSEIIFHTYWSKMENPEEDWYFFTYMYYRVESIELLEVDFE